MEEKLQKEKAAENEKAKKGPRGPGWVEFGIVGFGLGSRV